ncbi:NAD(P)/FAD-dependent oxidoreductase [Promicromonospora thailandica]|uniref:Thioredoxin reductase n=1 Tax=Promicromonospora thailandica TaxID=765201 RepID=A0A9X2G103_9MICO|nr:NAD(P)/FAD-dependent oxidoreductase [Promicromonospora thailandica]MCP2263262.1 Thioredoxin reductase [Promicromonospora thailandica]BFF18653.1 NAD(P)/FAD-dependent oxidoreductase [Promicromonospora thailandica]
MPQHLSPDAAIDPYDVIVVGGGPAGLQAALTLGRVRRSTLLLDSGEYRNGSADAIHNMVTRDGTTPAEFRATARAELAEYDSVKIREATATEIVQVPGSGFVVFLDNGGVVAGRTLLLATGLRDQLPPTPGLQELFGSLVAHCPYCHGFEYADTHVAVLGSGSQVPRMALLMERVASRITVLTNGGELDPTHRTILDAAGVTVRADEVTALRRDGSGVRVTFAHGADEQVGGVLVGTAPVQSAPFAEQLGLDLLPSGCTEVDPVGRTSMRGVYAAGDSAHTAATPVPLSSVVAAAAAGKNAAMALDADLLTIDHGLLAPGAPKPAGRVS